jgi:DNA-binding response OmpR family regulator
MPSRDRILVAEDDRQVRDLIRAHLLSAGFNVRAVRDGSEALACLSTFQPNAMVLDINMPEVDGFSVLEALGAAGNLIPVLVLTARHAADDVRRAISLGAKDYLTKPYSEAQLKARVARLLRAPAPVVQSVTLLTD